MLKDLIEKEDKIYKLKRNFGQAMKIIIKWRIEILEWENMVVEMKKFFDELISRLSQVEERIRKLESTSMHHTNWKTN